MKEHHHIIRGISKGESDSFKECYRLYADRVYNTAISFSQNKEDAEEITQDVFILIHKNASKFNFKSAVGTWIYRITVNTSLNFLKKKKRLKINLWEEISSEPTEFNHPGILLEQKESAAMLFSVIDQLPDQQKTAFILSKMEQLSQKEIAAVMENSVKAVESLLQRAKQNLRSKLEKTYPHRRKKKK